MKLTNKLRTLLRKGKLEAEMAEEMRLHLELQTERNIAGDMMPAEAHQAALRQFGNIGVIQQQAREQRPWHGGVELVADLRFAVRMLRKHPGFTLASVLTLALGIGFVTTLYTMINGVAFGQLPFEDASRIVSIGVPAQRFDDYARQQQSCEGIALAQPVSANLRAGAFVSRYAAAIVTTNFMEVLRARPAHGRGFLPEDSRAGAPRTVLIGHDLWTREFAATDTIAGREVQVNGEMHTIVGVVPEGFGFPFNQELWIARRGNEPVSGGMVFGRLRRDVSLRQASEQFTALLQSLAPDGRNGGFVWDADAKGGRATDPQKAVVEVVPFAERSVKQALRLMLSAILGATFLVLLLACANVANLVLARAVDRKKEMALRAALGASRGRLIRQMLTESVLVAMAGAVGGLFIASWTTQGIWTYMMTERPLTGGAPFWMNFDVDGRVFAFVTAVALLASVLTGLLPALQASRVDLNDALKDGAGGGLRVSRFSRILVNVQMAFSVCLVTVAGLFVTVLLAFNHKQLPYDPAAVLTAQVALEGKQYDDPVVRQRFFGQLTDRLKVAPGVEAAALTSAESLRQAQTPRIEVEGATYARETGRPSCWLEVVSPGFLEAFGVGLLAGRTFTAADEATAPPVAVVNAAFVQRFGADLDWIGRRFRLGDGGADTSPWITIIGIAPDLGSMKAGENSRGAVIYRPLAQRSDRTMTVLLRAGGDVSRFATTIRQAVASLDPDLPVARLQTVQQIVEMERVGMNSFSVLFIACGLGALVLASVGIYGVVSFAVKLRTREFGVRLALGATREIIIRMVVGQGVRQLRIGLGVGLLLAFGASAGLGSMFFGFGRSGHDWMIYGGVLMLLAGVAGAALFIPARRAARVDPMVALRTE
jgi:putative ABC transport system permease protein